MKSGSLNFLEPSGPVQACNGIALPLHFTFFLETEKLQTKVVEKIETHTLRSIIFFSKNHAIYEIIWKNMVQLDIPQMPDK